MKELHKVNALLTGPERRGFLWLTAAIVLMGLLEVVGVASILPFMKLVAAPAEVMKDPVLTRIIDIFGFTVRRHMIISMGVGVILLITFTNLFSIFTNWLKFKIAWNLAYTLSCRLLRGYLRRPYAYFLKTPTSETTSYIMTEVGSFTNSVLLPLIDMVTYSIVSLVLFGLLIWVDAKIAFIMFSVLGSAYVSIYLLQRNYLTRIGRLRIKYNVERYRALLEVFDGIKTVMAYNRQRFFYQHYASASKSLADLQPRYQVVMAAPRNVLEILAFSSIIGITVYFYLAEGGQFQLAIPKLSLYAVAGYRLLPALQRAFSAVGSYRHNFPVVEKLYPLVADHPDEGDFPATLPAPLEMQQSIELANVSFSYEESETPALDGIRLTIRQGETVAFVGSTGSGKTSLVDLLMGLLTPTDGDILIDGKPLQKTNAANWRAGIAYVPQEVFLFDDSVLNNIVIDDSGTETDAQRVENALRLADVYDFVMTLPQGINTQIGEKGVRLSGGQRQRLGLARALYTNPSVLILDEATSALDNVTERGIIDALGNLPYSVTTVVIAHRLSTVQHADRIYLLEKGRLTAQGAFQELIEKSNTFREMASLA